MLSRRIEGSRDGPEDLRDLARALRRRRELGLGRPVPDAVGIRELVARHLSALDAPPRQVSQRSLRFHALPALTLLVLDFVGLIPTQRLVALEDHDRRDLPVCITTDVLDR